MAFVDDPAARLNDILDAQEVRIADIFRTAIAGLKDEIDLADLADLLEQGRFEEAIARLKVAADALASASNVAFITSGQSTADFLVSAGVGHVLFDAVNYQAVAAMQANRLELIQEFTAEQRRATSAAIIAGVEAGRNPREQARDFRDSIGLTESQWEHVKSYREALEAAHSSDSAASNALDRALRDKRTDAQIRRAVKDAKPIPADKIDFMVQRYTDRYIKYRSEVIGRTEALRAVHEGNEEAYRQAIESGELDADKLDRKWVTRTDGRERRAHLLLNGKKAKWGEPWISIDGPLRYPGDPKAPARATVQCRCAIATRIRQ